MSLSLVAIPVFLDTTTSPVQIFREWERMYHYGHQVLPALSITTALLYSYTAWQRKARGRQWAQYLLAAGVTVAMIPFTLMVMVPTNDKLFALELASRTATTEFSSLDEARGLVIGWSRMHVIRAFSPLIGAAIGLTATLRGR